MGWSDFLNSVFAIALLAVALAEFIEQLFPHWHPARIRWRLADRCSNAPELARCPVALGTQQLTSPSSSRCFGDRARLPRARARGENHPPPRGAHRRGPILAAGAIAAFQLVLGALNGWAAPAYFGAEASRFGAWVAPAPCSTERSWYRRPIPINVAILYVVPVPTLVDSKLPAADAIERSLPPTDSAPGLGGRIFVAVAVLSLPSTLQAVMMQTSRTLHAMSVDGLFWRWGARISERGSPFNATWVCGAAALLLAVTSTFESLFLTFTVFAVLNNLILLCGVVRLRRREPDLPRPYRVIGYPWTLAPIVVVDLVVFTGFANTNLRQCLVSAALVAVLFAAYRAASAKGRFAHERRLAAERRGKRRRTVEHCARIPQRGREYAGIGVAGADGRTDSTSHPGA